MSSDIEDLRKTLLDYSTAFNAGNLDDLLFIFSPNAIFIAPHSRPASGEGAIRTAFEEIIAAMAFEIKMEILEIVPTAPDWAWARIETETARMTEEQGKEGGDGSGDKGKGRRRAGGETVREVSQGLLVLRKASWRDEAEPRWRIERFVIVVIVNGEVSRY